MTLVAAVMCSAAGPFDLSTPQRPPACVNRRKVAQSLGFKRTRVRRKRNLTLHWSTCATTHASNLKCYCRTHRRMRPTIAGYDPFANCCSRAQYGYSDVPRIARTRMSVGFAAPPTHAGRPSTAPSWWSCRSWLRPGARCGHGAMRALQPCLGLRPSKIRSGHTYKGKPRAPPKGPEVLDDDRH
jgi:hypothetical protein